MGPPEIDDASPSENDLGQFGMGTAGAALLFGILGMSLDGVFLTMSLPLWLTGLLVSIVGVTYVPRRPAVIGLLVSIASLLLALLALAGSNWSFPV